VAAEDLFAARGPLGCGAARFPPSRFFLRVAPTAIGVRFEFIFAAWYNGHTNVWSP
jgi:hypothetical protein